MSFPLSGSTPGVITVRIDDTAGPLADPALRGAMVVFNATGSAVTQQVSGQTLRQSDVQAGGSDPIVKQTTWDTATGTATVPARTVAVLLH